MITPTRSLEKVDTKCLCCQHLLKRAVKKPRRLSHGNDEHVLTLLLPFPLPHPGMPAAYDLSTVIGSGQPASHNNLIPLGMNLTSQWRLNMRLRGRELEGGVAGTHRRLQKNKIKLLINSQTIKQQKISRGRTWRSKYLTLMSSFEPSSSLGWSQTNCSWMFFFSKKDNIYKYTTHKRFGFRMEFQNMFVNSTRLPLIRWLHASNCGPKVNRDIDFFLLCFVVVIIVAVGVCSNKMFSMKKHPFACFYVNARLSPWR